MKNNIAKYLALVVLVVMSVGCTCKKEMQSVPSVGALLSAGQRVSLSGHLDRETYLGPPGYGETPEIDKKEVAYILVLDNRITFKNRAGDVMENVGEVHAVFPANIHPVLDTRIYFGQLDEGQTGHHRRRVMFYIE
jgi:hypothetical protein